MDYIDDDSLRQAAAIAGVPVESMRETIKYGGGGDESVAMIVGAIVVLCSVAAVVTVARR